MAGLLLAVLPWAAMGCAIVLALVYMDARRACGCRRMAKHAGACGPAAKQNPRESTGDALAMGMVLGVSGGMVLGAALMGVFGLDAFSCGAAFGLLLGTVAGIVQSRKQG